MWKALRSVIKNLRRLKLWSLANWTDTNGEWRPLNDTYDVQRSTLSCLTWITVYRFLHKYLALHALELRNVHLITSDDVQRRYEFAEFLSRIDYDNRVPTTYAFFYDKATFRTCGKHERHVFLCGGSKDTKVMFEITGNSSKINVWLSVMLSWTIGVFHFLEPTSLALCTWWICCW